MKPTFQVFASNYRKISSLQRIQFKDTKLPGFIMNKKFPGEVEINRNSTLMKGDILNQSAMPKLTTSRHKSPLPDTSALLCKSLPKAFNFIRKNKIQLLKQYIGTERATNKMNQSTNIARDVNKLLRERTQEDNEAQQRSLV